MIPAELPDNEDQRLAALHRYQLVDTAAEPVFDNITDLAGAICNAPIALITLVDATRQWFKSCRGLDIDQTEREVSFCAHTILQSDVLEIPDARADPRFHDNPLVTGPPHVRFYAGQPLLTPEGHGLGSICIIDTRPGRLNPNQHQALSQLGHVVSSLFEARRHARDALAEAEQARQSADRANAAKSRFLAAMSHEIRTPMNAVLGAADLLQTTRLDAEQRGYVDQVRHSGRHLLALIDDILDLSKLDANRLELVERPFDPRQEIDRALDMAASRAAGKDLELATELAADVAPAYRGDSDRLRQVLVNLTTNAVKFTPAGRVVVRARPLAQGGDADHLHIEVADTGPGIDAGTRQTLFQDFAQGEAGQQAGGTGLGLAISRRLVELMGGYMGVDSAPGEGSTFWLVVPLARAAAAALPAEADDAAPPLERPLKLLLAEDNAANQMVLEAQLQKDGHTVTVVGDGKAAVEAVASAPTPYDLVLMDLHMPQLDGYQAVAALRELAGDRARTPVLALTAQAMAGDRDRVLAAGFDDYMAKPLSMAAFRRHVRHWAAGEAATPADAAQVPPAPGDLGAPADAAPGTPPAAALEDHLERSQFDELRNSLGAAELGAFLRRMADDAQQRRDQARRAADADDFATAHGELHQLKGMARNLGIKSLRRAAERLEHAAAAADHPTLERGLAELPELLAALRTVADRVEAGEV